MPGIDWPNGLEGHLIAKPGGDCLRPLREFRPRPFETVIAVAHFPRRESREQHVILAIRSGDDHVSRPGKFEQYAFQGNQPRTIQMFDHFKRGNEIKRSRIERERLAGCLQKSNSGAAIPLSCMIYRLG